MSEAGAASRVMAASWRDYLEMTKPRVVLLMLLCALAGMFLATPDIPPLPIVLFGLLGIALVAGSAAAVNHIAESALDTRMARTRNRPVAVGRVKPLAGYLFAAVLGVAGMAVLLQWVNPLTAWLNLASWIGYGLVYTFYLKRATPQNIVIGGLFGAAPPLFGWTAVANAVELGGVLLVLIIFVWTPPHFWALALDRRKDYESVDIPMLPITHGDDYTRRQILYYTTGLCAVSLLPVAIGMSDATYLIGAILLGGFFLRHAIALLRGKKGAALATFRYSIVYLMALFAVLLVDHHIPNVIHR